MTRLAKPFEYILYWRKDYCYAGTLVAQGSAIIRVDKIGAATEYGKEEEELQSAMKVETLLGPAQMLPHFMENQALAPVG